MIINDTPNDSNLKYCPKCKAWKSRTEFAKGRDNKDGLQRVCRACDNVRRREHHLNHLEEEHERQREYAATHKDKIHDRARQYYLNHYDEIAEKRAKFREEKREYAKQWRLRNPGYEAKYREQNPEKAKERNRKRHENNREKRNKYSRDFMVSHPDYRLKWEQANPDKRRASGHRVAARKRNLPDNLTAADLKFAASHWKNTCAYCGKAFAAGVLPQDFDHFVPLSAGGGSIPENLVPACRSCNASKGANVAADWLRRKFGAESAARILKAIEDYFEVVKGRGK